MEGAAQPAVRRRPRREGDVPAEDRGLRRRAVRLRPARAPARRRAQQRRVQVAIFLRAFQKPDKNPIQYPNLQ